MVEFKGKRAGYLHQFNEHGLAVVKSYDHYGIINTKGEWLLDPVYKVIWDFTDGMAIVSKGSLYGAINTKCEIVIEERFETLSHFHDDRSAYRGDDKEWGFVDKEGNVIIAPAFKRVGWFSEGKCAVIDAGKKRWSFIDKQGSKVFDHTFEDAMCYTQGFAAVKMRGIWRFVNHDGQFLKF